MDMFEFWRAGASILLLAAIVPPALLALAIPYAVLRLRAGGEFDPQIGFNAALQFFVSLSLLVFMTGLTILVVDYIVAENFPNRRGFQMQPRQEFPTDLQRTAFALIASGSVFGALHFAAAMIFIDQPFTSPARRLFLGCRFAIHGLIVMITLTALLIWLFQSGDRGALEVQMLLGVLLVWAPSWVVHFALLRMSIPPAPIPMMDDVRRRSEY